MNPHPPTPPTPPAPPTDEPVPHPAVVDVPPEAIWKTETVADIHADHVIRHPTTGQPVVVIGWRNAELPSPLGPDPWWRRPRIPARELTLAPAGMYAHLIEITLPNPTALQRLDRLFTDPPRLYFLPEPPTPGPRTPNLATPNPGAPDRPARPVPDRPPNTEALNGALAQRRTGPQPGRSYGPGMSR